jgi:DNA topoisomerase VI subunit B
MTKKEFKDKLFKLNFEEIVSTYYRYTYSHQADSPHPYYDYLYVDVSQNHAKIIYAFAYTVSYSEHVTQVELRLGKFEFDRALELIKYYLKQFEERK